MELLPFGKSQFLDNVGAVLASGTLSVYNDDESSLVETYTLDSAGRADVRLGQKSKLVLADSNTVRQWVVNKVVGISAATAIQDGSSNFSVDTGTADAYVATLSPVPAALTKGLTVRLLIANSNTGSSTLNVNGLGVRIIRLGTKALSSGMLVASEVRTFVYDGAYFQLQGQVRPPGIASFLGAYGAATTLVGNTETALNVGTPRIDNHSWYAAASPTIVTVPGGVQKVSLEFQILSAATGPGIYYNIRKNGALLFYRIEQADGNYNGSVLGNQTAFCRYNTGPFTVSAGDQLSIGGFKYGGATAGVTLNLHVRILE